VKVVDPTVPCLGVEGGVELCCSVDGSERSYLSSQRFSPPVHLSKPYFDEETGHLLVNLSCPTAGLLEGDKMSCRVTVEDGASLVLTTPGATRAHVMRSGEARVEQEFRVEGNGFMEFNPGTLILQRDASLAQRTSLEFDSDSEVLFVETLLPGRLAHGESFSFRKFSNLLIARQSGKLVLRESYLLTPGDSSVTSWQNSFPEPHYGAFYLFSPKVRDELPSRKALHGLAEENLLIGATALFRSGWLVKVLAGDAVLFKRTMDKVRASLYEDLERPMPSFRRY
jgi:urease accessory protein